MDFINITSRSVRDTQLYKEFELGTKKLKKLINQIIGNFIEIILKQVSEFKNKSEDYHKLK